MNTGDRSGYSAPVFYNSLYFIYNLIKSSKSDNILSMNNFNFLSKTPKEIDKLIAARIRSIRRRRKISQKRLSEKSGVSLGSVKRFESSGEISLISLTKIAIALDIENELEGLFEHVPFLSIEELINGENEKTES